MRVRTRRRNAMQAEPSLLWIGDSEQADELRLTVASLQPVITTSCLPTAAAAFGAAGGLLKPPTIICLAEQRPGQYTAAEAIALSRQWPLARLIVVATCLADGRRRSGPPLPGVTDVSWHDLPSRVRFWVTELTAGRSGSLGTPLTARRDERWLETLSGPAAWEDAGGPDTLPDPPRVSVAAASGSAAEAVADLVATAGGRVIQQQTGRPQLIDEADVIVWDTADTTASHLSWLRLLTSQRPERSVVLLTSFPRGDAVVDALEAGAMAVLGRPVDREALSGVLRQRQTALSATAGVR